MNMVALQSFGFEGNTVRVIDRGDAPWFVAQDVCACVEIANHRNVIAALDEDEKGVHSVDTLGGVQEVSIVSESGLYALIFKSRKPAAVRFRKWVTSEVLPALRRTGRFVLDSAANDDRGDSDWVLPDETNLKLAVMRAAESVFTRSQRRRLWHKLGLPTPDDANVLLALPGNLGERAIPAIACWLAARCVIERGAKTPASELYEDYLAFCDSQSLEVESQRSFGGELGRLGFESFHSNGTWRRGLRLKD